MAIFFPVRRDRMTMSRDFLEKPCMCTSEKRRTVRKNAIVNRTAPRTFETSDVGSTKTR